MKEKLRVLVMRRLFIPLVLAAALSMQWGGSSKAQDATGAAGAGQRVLVIPFTALNIPDAQQWISRGVQENLVADFGRTTSLNPIAFQGQVVVEDNATAARLARQASAPLAVRGAAQIVGDQLRLTAQVIDAKTGDTLSAASVTGPASDLLKMEDELSAQLRGVSGAPAAPAIAPAAPPAQPAQTVQPQIIVITQPAPDYSYPPYPAYNYSYPFFYPYVGPLVISDAHGRRHHREFSSPHLIRSTGPSGGPLTPRISNSSVLPLSFSGGLIPNTPQGGNVPISSPGILHFGNNTSQPQLISNAQTTRLGRGRVR
jgi:TolB-like protein